MTRRKRWLTALLIAVAVLALVYIGRRHLLPPVARWLNVAGAPRQADYVMVLPGDENVRPFVAAALVRTGHAEAVLVPTTETGPEVEDGIRPPTHEIIRRVLLHRGVPEEKIVILRAKSRHTTGDAQGLADFLEASPGASVSVVTSAYHTRRARFAFAGVLGERMDQVSFVATPNEGFSPEDWWQSPGGFVAIVGENLKLLCYFAGSPAVTYGLAGCASAAVALVVWRGRRRRRSRPVPRKRAPPPVEGPASAVRQGATA